MAKKLFREEQTFVGYEAIAVLGITIVAFIYVFIKELFYQNDQDYFLTELLCIVFILGIGYGIHYLLKLRLKTSVTEKNIAFQLKPFHSKKYKIKIKDIEDCAIVKTPPMLQWHGGNISFQHEAFYSFSGRNGLAVTTRSGKNYFIGSKKLDELEQIVQRVVKG